MKLRGIAKNKARLGLGLGLGLGLALRARLVGTRSRPHIALITAAGCKADRLVNEADRIAHPLNKQAYNCDAKRIANHESQLPLGHVVRELDAVAREALQGQKLECAETPGAGEAIVQLVAGVAAGEAGRLTSIR